MNIGLRYFCFLCLPLLATQVVFADMSGWSDKTVCRLVAQQGKQEFIDEATDRRLRCISNNSNQKSTASQSKNLTKTRIGTDSSDTFPDCSELYRKDVVERDWIGTPENILVGATNSGNVENCRIIATSKALSNYKGGNIWFNPWLALRNTDDNKIQVVAYAHDQGSEAHSVSLKPGLSELQYITLDVDKVFSYSGGEYIENPNQTKMLVNSRRRMLADVDGDGFDELIMAGTKEDGRKGLDETWETNSYFGDYNYVFDFESNTLSNFSKGDLFSHDMGVADLNDDGFVDVLDMPMQEYSNDRGKIFKGSGRKTWGIWYCDGKESVTGGKDCKLSLLPPHYQNAKSSVAAYPDKKGGMLVTSCFLPGASLCWFDLSVKKNGKLKIKQIALQTNYGEPNVSYHWVTWGGDKLYRTNSGFKIPGISTSEAIITNDSTGWETKIADVDNDGDLDTIVNERVTVCTKEKNEKYFHGTRCESNSRIQIYINDRKKMKRTTDILVHKQSMDIQKIDFMDINSDGHKDIVLSSNDQDWHCQKRAVDVLAGDGNGTFERMTENDFRKLHGYFGCEQTSQYIEKDGQVYRVFYTHKYDRYTNQFNLEKMYLAIERVNQKDNIVMLKKDYNTKGDIVDYIR